MMMTSGYLYNYENYMHICGARYEVIT